MKLYDSRTAPNPRRTRIFLAEKGIALPLVPVDIMKKEAQTAEFTAMNPMQRLPVLELDDGTHLCESIAICRYFEELQPEPPLFGVDPLDRARVEMWHRWIELDVFLTITFAFRHSSEAMAHLQIPQVPDWAAANRELLEERLRWLDGVLAGRPFIAGERFSMVDITAVVAMDFMRVVGRRLGDDTPNLKTWHARVAERPSYKA